MVRSSKKSDPTTPYAHLPPFKTVKARNLPRSMDESDLRELFKQAGKVVELGSHQYDGRFSGTCHVEYATQEAAKKALELDGQKLCNRTIRVKPRITGASKTLVAQNLSLSTTKLHVMNFFKQCGEIADVRFSTYMGGTCFIEFATEEGAKKAAELNGKELLDRPLVLGFARENIYVRGFDTSLGWDTIRSSLEELFSTCGKISRIHIPTIPFTDIPQGKAFIEFYDYRDLHKALAMNGQKLGGCTLTVEDAVPHVVDLKPTGFRKFIGGIRVGPYSYSGPCNQGRGWGGAGIGKERSVYQNPPGKRIIFDDDSPGGIVVDD